MATPKPKVGVVMPVCNGERYIAEAIESVLAQTYPNWELVVVNDGSTDHTFQVLQRFTDPRIIYVEHSTRRGIPFSMNDGVHHSSADLISFLDHDDAWLPDMLETQVAYLQEHPDVGMVHADFQTIDQDGHILEESVAKCRNRIRPSGHVFAKLFLDCFIVGNSVLIRRECFEKLGGFDESLRFGDYDMWLRIARHYRVDYIAKTIAKYRQHPTQSTRNHPTARPDQDAVVLAVMEKWLRECPEIRQELGNRGVNRRFAGIYFGMAYAWFGKGAFANVRSCLRRAIHFWPTNYAYYGYYVASLLPASLAWRVRKGWRHLRSTDMAADAQMDKMTAIGPDRESKAQSASGGQSGAR